MNQTTELTFSFRVPGCGIASALAGLAIAAQIEKLLSENGCVLRFTGIYPTLSEPVTGETADAAEAATQKRIAEGATALSAGYGASAELAPTEATPAPEPEKSKRRAKAEPAKAPEPEKQPEKQPEPPQAAATPAPDPANGIICCEKLAGIHRAGRSAAAVAFMPQWNGVTEAITAAGYSGVTAIKAALGDPKTAAQAAADVTAILAVCEQSLADLEATIAAKKAKADADDLD
jgi:hypothetical protein